MGHIRQYWDKPERTGGSKKLLIVLALIILVIVIFIILVLISHPRIIINSAMLPANGTYYTMFEVKNAGTFRDSEAKFSFSTEPLLKCDTILNKNCVQDREETDIISCSKFYPGNSVIYRCEMESNNFVTATIKIDSRYQVGLHMFGCSTISCEDVTPEVRGSFPVLANYLYWFPLEVLGFLS